MDQFLIPQHFRHTTKLLLKVKLGCNRVDVVCKVLIKYTQVLLSFSLTFLQILILKSVLPHLIKAYFQEMQIVHQEIGGAPLWPNSRTLSELFPCLTMHYYGLLTCKQNVFFRVLATATAASKEGVGMVALNEVVLLTHT